MLSLWRRSVRSLASALCAALALGAWGAASAQQPEPPPGLTALRGQLEPLIAWLDSAEYAASVSWEEHIVLVYQFAQGRAPSALELRSLLGARDELDLRRSDALAIALRGAQAVPRAAALRTGARAFRPNARARQLAARLAAVPQAELLRAGLARLREGAAQAPAARAAAPAAAPGEFRVYYGYLHAHSGLSDGKGRPDEAYAYARDVAGLDFFGLTDHGELLRIWPWENKWSQLRAAADRHDAPGRFAALWGFEWSSPIFGHINILMSRDHTDAVTTPDLRSLYEWLRARPAAFGRFNHPGRIDSLRLEFAHLALYPGVLRQMVGIETFNKGDGFRETHYECEWAGCAGTYLDHGNLQGWSLGAVGGQDNHSRDWGTDGEYRVGVWARELTRAAITEAYFARRFFATEDRDLSLDFRAGEAPMGSVLPAGALRRFRVSACDRSGDSFSQLRLYRDGEPIAVHEVSGSCFELPLEDPSGAGAQYYYAIVRQLDDSDGDGRPDEALSSPIWFAD